MSASCSYDGVSYRQVGSAVTFAGAAGIQDGSIFATSHDATTAAINVFRHDGGVSQTETPPSCCADV